MYSREYLVVVPETYRQDSRESSREDQFHGQRLLSQFVITKERCRYWRCGVDKAVDGLVTESWKIVGDERYTSDHFTLFWKGFETVTWDEPCCFHVVSIEHLQQSFDADFTGEETS